jgi:tRNA(fMet)-specific endonuclease VapC
MNGRYLLDTNIIIGLFAGDESITKSLEQANVVFVASVVLGELYFGALKSQRIQENLARIDEFAADCSVLNVDSETATRYGEIKNSLRSKGHPIPENDIWIAAIALQHSLILATRDDHFAQVEGLAIEHWI